MRANYHDLSRSVASLTENETDEVALMATVACELHHSDDRFDWTGFYRVTSPNVLKIGPYQGGHGCLMIPFSNIACCNHPVRDRAAGAQCDGAAAGGAGYR